MGISSSNASSQNMERFQRTKHKICKLKILSALRPFLQITKGEQRSGNRKGRERGGERGRGERPRSGLLRDDVGI